MLLGEVCGKLSAMNTTEHFAAARIRKNKYWQRKTGTLMRVRKSIKACILHMSTKIVLIAIIDT